MLSTCYENIWLGDLKWPESYSWTHIPELRSTVIFQSGHLGFWPDWMYPNYLDLYWPNLIAQIHRGEWRVSGWQVNILVITFSGSGHRVGCVLPQQKWDLLRNMLYPQISMLKSDSCQNDCSSFASLTAINQVWHFTEGCFKHEL